MALRPGGGPSPGSPGPRPPRGSPGSPERGRAPRPNAAPLSSVVHWGLLIGGLVIIVDLGTRAIEQSAGAAQAGGSLDVLNLALNGVLYAVLGTAILRETGRVRLAALAGLLAGMLDGIVVGAAAALAPPKGVPTGTRPEELWQVLLMLNTLLGTLLTTSSAWFSRLIRRPRPGS